MTKVFMNSIEYRVSVQGVKSLGGHFACLCRGFGFSKVKKKKIVIIFQKLLHFLSFLWWKVFKKSKISQIYYCDPQSARINLQSPQSDSTPWTLTLPVPASKKYKKTLFAQEHSQNLIYLHFIFAKSAVKDQNVMVIAKVGG